jgi:hypothetical protein
VEVVGAGDLEEELRARLRTRDGEGYDAAAVRDDLADLRSEPAVARARAETVRDEDGVVVRFSIVRADRLLVQPSAERAQAVVAEVRVRGNRRIEPAPAVPTAPPRSRRTCGRSTPWASSATCACSPNRRRAGAS